MQLNINGAPVEVTAGPGDLLLWVLRDELGMIGMRFWLRRRYLRRLHCSCRRHRHTFLYYPAGPAGG